jgi:zinc protease
MKILAAFAFVRQSILMLVSITCLSAFPTLAMAIDIQEVTSPGGVKAWLVEAHEIPLIAMNFAFSGGTTNDAVGKEGTGNFLTGMMDEGAGDMDGPAFRDLRDRLSVSISFSAASENFYGNLYTLSKNRDAAFSLLTKAVTAPRFEAEPLDRMRKYYVQQAADYLKDPGTIASLAWTDAAYPNHPYSRRTSGTIDTLGKISADDLRQFHKTVFTRDKLKIAVVGDIDAKSLGLELDRVFGSLPDTPVPDVIPMVEVKTGLPLQVIDYDSPQSIVIFGGKGTPPAESRDYPSYILSEIVGGGASFARLTREVREKRGLTYGTSFSLNNFNKSGYSFGYLTTANETAAEAIKVTKQVLQEMADKGPTPEEMALAKTYITGSYAMRFTSNSAIASTLLAQQIYGYPINQTNIRNGKVNAVTIEQVQQQAKKLLQADQLNIVVIGKPVGLGK